MRVLVVYFSRDGHTERMAREIARRCEAHLEQVRVARPGHSWIASVRAHWQALIRANPTIVRPSRNPQRYELVIIGVPASRSGIAPPLRSYIELMRDRFGQVAFFCAEGDAAGRRSFEELARLCGRMPVATFDVDRKGLPPAAHLQALTDFMDSVRPR